MEMFRSEEEFRAFMDRRQMEADSNRQEVERFFRELSDEHLVTLRRLLEVMSNETSGRFAAYLEGLAVAFLVTREVCPSCGKNHEAELLNSAHEPEPKEDLDEEPEAQHEQLELDLEQTEGDPIQNFYDNCREYEVAPKDENNLKSEVVCLNCGSSFKNLEDRMLRPPGVEGCKNCQHIAKWG